MTERPAERLAAQLAVVAGWLTPTPAPVLEAESASGFEPLTPSAAEGGARGAAGADVNDEQAAPPARPASATPAWGPVSLRGVARAQLAAAPESAPRPAAPMIAKAAQASVSATRDSGSVRQAQPQSGASVRSGPPLSEAAARSARAQPSASARSALPLSVSSANRVRESPQPRASARSALPLSGAGARSAQPQSGASARSGPPWSGAGVRSAQPLQAAGARSDVPLSAASAARSVTRLPVRSPARQRPSLDASAYERLPIPERADPAPQAFVDHDTPRPERVPALPLTDAMPAAHTELNLDAMALDTLEEALADRLQQAALELGMELP